mmetsp:Transcript_18373/g.39526  ORF Transcript_18373/g.39526 Transcript_18373/m.39526 type:complete len:218 (+) Transcript_18373:492-1145(+)
MGSASLPNPPNPAKRNAGADRSDGGSLLRSFQPQRGHVGTGTGRDGTGTGPDRDGMVVRASSRPRFLPRGGPSDGLPRVRLVPVLVPVPSRSCPRPDRSSYPRARLDLLGRNHLVRAPALAGARAAARARRRRDGFWVALKLKPSSSSSPPPVYLVSWRARAWRATFTLLHGGFQPAFSAAFFHSASEHPPRAVIMPESSTILACIASMSSSIALRS